MMIYIDDEYKCHTADAEGYRPFDVPFMDGKCRQFIEGYRYIPTDETWEREDGTIFKGEMTAPWVDYVILSAAQEAYEEAFADRADMENALNTLGVSA